LLVIPSLEHLPPHVRRRELSLFISAWCKRERVVINSPSWDLLLKADLSEGAVRCLRNLLEKARSFAEEEHWIYRIKNKKNKPIVFIREEEVLKAMKENGVRLMRDTFTFGEKLDMRTAVVVAIWESNRTLGLEWSAGRDLGARALRQDFPSALEASFPGMADAAGFKDFLAADTIARGHWSRKQHTGSLLGGVLTLPLGARQILVLPAATVDEVRDPYKIATHRRPPDASDIARAQDSGAQWFLWESDEADDLPESLAPFDERYRFRVTDDASLRLVWIGRQPRHAGPGTTGPAGR
jgi:hypothetical protein